MSFFLTGGEGPGAVRGFQKGGGEISNVVVFKKILKNWPSWLPFQTNFCERGGASRLWVHVYNGITLTVYYPTFVTFWSIHNCLNSKSMLICFAKRFISFKQSKFYLRSVKWPLNGESGWRVIPNQMYQGPGVQLAQGCQSIEYE